MQEEEEPPKTEAGEERRRVRGEAGDEATAQAEGLRSRIERLKGLSEDLQDELARVEQPKDVVEESGAAGARHAGQDDDDDVRGGEGASLSAPDAAAGRPITVLVADDHAMVREGMAQMLSLHDDVVVVAQAGDGREAVALAREANPDVAILDVEMPVMGAQAALKRLLELPSPPKVIVVTVFAERRLVRELLGLGASAFLSKSASSQDLAAAVRSVARGGGDDNVIVSVPRSDYDAEGPPAETMLSRREAEVLRMVARGMGNKEVGDLLHLSETTVKRHLSNVYDKLGARTRGEAVSKAVSEGWISSWDIGREE